MKSQREGLNESAVKDAEGGDSRPEYDLAGQVIGLAMKVHRTLGPGFLELVYQRTLLYELTKAGVSVESDQLIQVRYEGVIVGDFKADLVVKNELIIELKAVSALAVEHEVQLVNYLTATGIEFGLLLNFGGRSLQFKKKFRTPKPESFSLEREITNATFEIFSEKFCIIP